MSDSNAPSPYRFVIVLVVTLASFLGNYVIFQMAGLAPRIIEAAGLSGPAFGLVIGVSILTAAVFGLPLGALGDRLGVKPVVGAAIVVTLIGSVGRWAAAPSLGGYLFWMFLIGAANAALNANFIKILGVWLPPSGIGLGVGCYLVGIGLGQAVSIATGPRFAALGPAYLSAVALSAAVLVLWLVLIKNPPNLPRSEPLPMSHTLKFVAGKRDIWVGGIGIFFMLGTYVTATSFTGSFLVGSKGLTEGSAALCASLITVAMLVGGLASDRVAKIAGSSRLFLVAAGILAAVGTVLILRLPYGFATLASLALLGFSVGAYCSFILSLPMLLSYVGPVYAGSAGGLISTLQSAGGFFLPYLFPMLAGDSPAALFGWIAAGFALMGLVTVPLPELVKRG